MIFDLKSINIDELIEFKKELLKTNRITITEFTIITRYLSLIIDEKGE